MIHNPKIGAEYWTIVDVYGDACPVPVLMVNENEGLYTGRWEITENYTEDYEDLTDKDLYPSEKEAWAYIQDERRKADAGERNGLFSRQNFG